MLLIPVFTKKNGVFVVGCCFKTNGITTMNNNDNKVYFASTGIVAVEPPSTCQSQPASCNHFTVVFNRMLGQDIFHPIMIVVFAGIGIVVMIVIIVINVTV